MTLRRSLLGGMVALTAAALTLVGATSVLAVRSDLLRQIDDQLHLAGGVAKQRVAALSGLDPMDPGLREVIGPSDYVVELRGAPGLLRVSGPERLPTGALLGVAPVPPGDGSVSPPATVLAGAYRVVSVRTADTTVAVGLPLAPVHRTVARLTAAEVVGGLAVLVLLAGFAWVLLARGMRPLEEITATATAIAGGDLERRMPVAVNPRTEVGRLTLAVNGMLARIEVALAARARSEQRMRDFVADASHELRTPLTSIRGYLQLLRQGIVPDRTGPTPCAARTRRPPGWPRWSTTCCTWPASTPNRRCGTRRSTLPWWSATAWPTRLRYSRGAPPRCTPRRGARCTAIGMRCTR